MRRERLFKLGSKNATTPGYDLTGFFVGSEGTLGIVTEVIVKLTKKPEAVATLLAIYDSVDDAGRTVVAITAEGITPAALEMLDGWTLRTVEAATACGISAGFGGGAADRTRRLAGAGGGAGGGGREGLRERSGRARCGERVTRKERDLLWAGRKNAFGAIGRISPSYYVQDGVIPRTKIPETLRRIGEISENYELTIGNIFHAGDGNLSSADPVRQSRRGTDAQDHRAGAEILEHCIAVGGSITGEHGVGMEKQDMMCRLFREPELALMRSLRDAFNPQGILNPQKLLPTTKVCREMMGVFRRRLQCDSGPRDGD